MNPIQRQACGRDQRINPVEEKGTRVFRVIRLHKRCNKHPVPGIAFSFQVSSLGNLRISCFSCVPNGRPYRLLAPAPKTKTVGSLYMSR